METATANLLIEKLLLLAIGALLAAIFLPVLSAIQAPLGRSTRWTNLISCEPDRLL